ncbi:MAG: hypothetical protein HC927_07695 [Deltaproteobacteria bacterium]|nr:hypothetical protein [Deltaproteobacteria bacterium]
MANDRSKNPAELELPVFGRKVSPLLSADQRQISDNAVAFADTSKTVAMFDAPGDPGHGSHGSHGSW